jgi:aminopeptidase N
MMVRFFLCSAALLFVSLAGQAQLFDDIEKTARRDAVSYQQKAGFVESENATKTDFIYQRMEWIIDPSVRFIQGKITTRFICNTEALDKVEFDLFRNMTVDSVYVGTTKVDFIRPGDKIQVQLADTMNAGETDSVKIWYHGEPVTSGFGSFTLDTHNGVPVLWTLSEPYGAREWWPCKQSLTDKIDSIDIYVTTPGIHRTASNGVLVSEEIANGKRITHWKHRHPIVTYLVAIAVTNYADYSDTLLLDDGREVEILNFVYPESENDARQLTPVTVEVMELFNRLIGEYPFANEKYGHAQFGWGGGMEHQTMSFMGSFGFGLVAHELAHQWFGNYITLGSWQDIWLNEGFATYLTGLAYENLLDGRLWPQWKSLAVERITSQSGGSVFVEDTTSVNRLFDGRLSYNKGAYILHMLRWIMSDEEFFEAIKNYYTDPLIANGFARTNQLIQHLELVADTSFTEFFEDWFYGQGYPRYSIAYHQPNPSELNIRLSQTTSHQSVDFFEMPVPIRVYNATKSDSANFRLDHMQNNQLFIVNPGFEVAHIVIDPENWLIAKAGTIVNVQEVETTDEFRVYPNPFSNRLQIVLPSGETIKETSLYSITGELLFQTASTSLLLELPDLQGGEYVIQVKTKQNSYRQLIIKY